MNVVMVNSPGYLFLLFGVNHVIRSLIVFLPVDYFKFVRLYVTKVVASLEFKF